jgi:hypothetical protein
MAGDDATLWRLEDAEALARGANFAGGSVRGHDLILWPN